MKTIPVSELTNCTKPVALLKFMCMGSEEPGRLTDTGRKVLVELGVFKNIKSISNAIYQLKLSGYVTNAYGSWSVTEAGVRACGVLAAKPMPEPEDTSLEEENEELKEEINDLKAEISRLKAVNAELVDRNLKRIAEFTRAESSLKAEIESYKNKLGRAYAEIDSLKEAANPQACLNGVYATAAEALKTAAGVLNGLRF